MGGRKREVIEQVVGRLVKEFDGSRQTVVEETEVETDVEHLLLLPTQFRVGEALMAETGVVAVQIVVGGHPEAERLVAAQAGVVT